MINSDRQSTGTPQIGKGHGMRALETVPVSSLKIPDYVVRKNGVKGPVWEAFVNSVKTLGLIRPPTVDLDRNVVLGQRRVLAAKEAGLEKIDVLRYAKKMPVAEALAMELIENLQWESVDEYDRWDSLFILSDLCGKNREKMEQTLGLPHRFFQLWMSLDPCQRESHRKRVEDLVRRRERR